MKNWGTQLSHDWFLASDVRLQTLRHRIVRLSEETLFCSFYRGKCDKAGHLVLPFDTFLIVTYFYTKPNQAKIIRGTFAVGRIGFVALWVERTCIMRNLGRLSSMLE